MKNMLRVFISSILPISLFNGCVQINDMASTVAVVGGADGPTAVFVTSHTSIFVIIAGVAIAVVTVALLIYAFFRKK